jgi:alkylated DNA nucleotide flippase Atl1
MAGSKAKRKSWSDKARRMSWREKLMDSKNLPLIEPVPEKMVRTCGEGTLVVPAPLEVDRMMRKVPEGRLVTINQIREALARKHGTTIACPMCTGIFASIAARAAAEAAEEGETDITPYWRTLKEGGVINEKYPGGLEGQKAKLEAEGHVVMQKGRKLVVQDFDKKTIEL